jgi:kynureninase
MLVSNSRRYAVDLDKRDPLADYRKQFFIPKHNGKITVYLTGNSLGLQPRQTADRIKAELTHWAQNGVEGHFRGEKPWKDYHHFLKAGLGRLVGAAPVEVTPMPTLTGALHLLMVSFYRPTATRFKIIMEAKAFSSDLYAVETQVRMHGLDPAEAIIAISPELGKHTISHEQIENALKSAGDSVALLMLGGVNYYNGQWFDLARLTKAAHAVGAYAGFDLAHAAGNLPMKLHDWGVDFACWCGYKYLNSGPGGAAGIFVHDRHADRTDLVRLAGWWGHNEQERFQMEPGFKPMRGADSWQQSNAPILSYASLLSSLDLFDKVGMDALRAKSEALSGYLFEWLHEIIKNGAPITILTPAEPQYRGCQVSLLTGPEGRNLFDTLTNQGIIADWREPNVIRIAPVPFYNRFEDIYQFASAVAAFYK